MVLGLDRGVPMTDFAWGGARHRLIRDSMFRYVKSNMVGLGWTSDRPWHKPVEIRADAVTDDETIVPNVIALADEPVKSTPWELGSLLDEDRWTLYWDVYAESDTIGLHIVHDIRDLLKGRHPPIDGGIVSIGPVLDVFDYSQAGSPPIFFVELENIDVDRGRAFAKEWQRVWFSCRVEILDYYGAVSDG